MRTHRVLIAAAAVWCGLIVATPIMASGEGVFRTAAAALYVFFSAICHQWDSHSFHLFGEKFPVCIRCSGIYFGFLLGIVLYPRLGKGLEHRFGPRRLLFAAIAGMAIDVMLSVLGISESTVVTRLVTGAAFGILTAFVLTPVLHALIDSIVPDAG
jgi:uncharacterized membrane protein